MAKFRVDFSYEEGGNMLIVANNPTMAKERAHYILKHCGGMDYGTFMEVQGSLDFEATHQDWSIWKAEEVK